VPFVRFALPIGRPPLWDVLLLAGVLIALGLVASFVEADLVGALALEGGRVGAQPWRLLTWIVVQADWLGVATAAVGLTVGMTMAARRAGRRIAWGGLAGAALLPGLYAWWALEPTEVLAGASAALYCALGMGFGAWFQMRHELTYRRRVDRIAALGALGLVALALAIPRVVDAPVRWIHVIGFAWGLVLLLVAPSGWTRGSPAVESGRFAGPSGS
jgi:membrane associated rhomboid family serine protease